MSLPENHHPHSRFILKETPWGYNAKDLIHNDVSGPVFDLGVDLDDRYGIAYIRVSDVEEMGRVLGMATKAEVAALKARIEELNGEVRNVPNEVDKLKDGLDELVSDFLDRVVPRSDAGVPVADSKGTEEVTGQYELPIADNDPTDSEAGKESGSSDNVPVNKRPAKLSSGSGDGNIFGIDL